MTQTTSGTITDEAIARLRARVGVAEPWTRRPHYLRPNTDTFRIVAEAYGDDNPLWGDPDHATASVWGGPVAPPPLVGGDSLIGEDEVTAVPDDLRDLMKGDPLRGVHAFYSASAREWWAPLRPDHRVWRRNALVAVLDKPSEFAGRAVHEWSANVFRDDDGTMLSGQYRLMIRTERTKAREKKKYDAIELASYSDEEIDAIEAEYAAYQRRGGEPRYWEDVDEGDTVGPMVKGPLTVTDMVCWHVGHGHGPLRREAARAGRRRTGRTDPPVLPPRRPERARRDAAGALGSGVGPPRREPDHLRLRSHARDVADPLLHRLDGRRRAGSGSSSASSAGSTTSVTCTI